ncbi:hypothetical protein EN828_23660 [Mesorhizobium sp. M2D.F.Ca.ET.185.01.1.1]|uniref:hypothetical protein n=1 Tax=unclassified Mesorhizobium TaxID=325217 RepID=UPI000FCA0000|nr:MULTISPECIES: hypothetical protein [unclassified Mesorhizobium]TGP77173.1 hypothetical protein EN870_21455 [bacterium M00.F.Ca.ET.227.01.1.1]TGP84543.1 hypothetical protein EN864_30170 [bacterium M00.F.Ca.ET.221.01.1.1]TGP88690.1 hypothetical protein EN865_27110 [bacterium M00.F.Ca.ET.222.01.1.1]TGT70847.1 hypothetical protein EN802_21250 [bacterium M00.F.Ca.ET.159.01.1.1]TGT82490.1 hypothetical protein EN800_19410 [bacterium M00.F.Ca.ET.157.01.1.1]TGT98154.1 hypothetical protein EN806_475
MLELLDLELANARRRLNRAERALEHAEDMLEADCGVGINLAICCRIRSAQRRVADARQRLAKIDPRGPVDRALMSV